MTDLQLIAEKAIGNGFKLPEEWGFNKRGELVNWSMEAGLIGLPTDAHYAIIFSHGFCQAYWGEWKDENQMKREVTDAIQVMAKSDVWVLPKSRWEYHISELAKTEPDKRIAYLLKYLDTN